MGEKGIKVLVVDDDVALGDVIVMCLKSEGYDVEYTTSLLAMESLVGAFRPNIIVLDVEVGEGNGIDEMNHILEYAPGIPVVFISSHVDSDTVVRAIKAGGENFLRKPLDMAELVAYINRYTNNKGNVVTRIEKIGSVSIGVDDRVLTHADGTTERLTKMQHEVLLTLIHNANNITSRKLLNDKLWPDGNGSSASLDNLISKLRKILSQDTDIKIDTLSKMGFALRLKS